MSHSFVDDIDEFELLKRIWAIGSVNETVVEDCFLIVLLLMWLLSSVVINILLGKACGF
jgi:hypothetical protein